jgi:hypothetical protein
MKEFESIREKEAAVFVISMKLIFQRNQLEKKLQMSSKRKEEQMRVVREKAAAANEQARIKAEMIHASRKTPDKTRICLTCNVEVS